MIPRGKRILSAVLSVSMLLPLMPTTFALANDAANDVEERSYFDFEASEYEVGEKDGQLKIKIVRHGEGKEAAEVGFKVADFLSEYGVDYAVLDAYGQPLDKVQGGKPEMSEFVYEDGDAASDTSAETDEQEEQTEQTAQTEQSEQTAQGEQAAQGEDAAQSEAETQPEEQEALRISESAQTKSTAAQAEISVPEAEEQPDADINISADAQAADTEQRDTDVTGDADKAEAEQPNVDATGDADQTDTEQPDADATDDADQMDAAQSNADATDDADQIETKQPNADTTGDAENNTANTDTQQTVSATQMPDENTAKKNKSTGSPLLDAQAIYLDLPEQNKDEQTEAAVKQTLDDLYNYFASAQGAQGVVHFAQGETEKTITVKLYDNDRAEQNKIFMLALMGTDTEGTMIAPNATTYVTILDDEPAEAAYFELEDNRLTLYPDSPEGYVTITRSSGIQYFATAYLSTVRQTAEDGAYEHFEQKAVAFVPGETEKQVKITAYDFSKDAVFGVRLEAVNDDQVGNYYAEVAIQAADRAAVVQPSNVEDTQPTDTETITSAEGDGEVSLMADNVSLGSAYGSKGIDIPGGWKKDVTGEGSAWTTGGNLFIEQYDKNKHTMWVSNQKQNLIGVKKIRYSMYVTNPTRGFNTRYHDYTSYFETDSDQSFSGQLDSNPVYGNSGWQERDLTLRKSGDAAYLKFSTKPSSGGWHNSQAELDWLRFDYAYYKLSKNDSAETFQRQVYDFTQGTPNVYPTYYEGETTRIYQPGGVVITRGDDTVGGFYANNGDSITITAANQEKNARNGIYFKGVYFAKGDINAKTLFSDGRYRTNNVYYVAASNGKVTLTPNRDFVSKLRDKGVIDGVHGDATIQVFPVFGQEYVTVNFENADRDDTKAATKGKFDSNYKASYIVNILEAYQAGNLTKKKYANWLDYYSINVPKYSIIRVQTQPIASRAAWGIVYWYHGKNGAYTTYYKAGERKASSTVSTGEEIEQTDYTMADIVANGSMSMKPATDQQSFSVSYFPGEQVPDVYQGATGLTNAVVPTDALDPSKLVDGGVYKIKSVNSDKYLTGTVDNNVVQSGAANDNRALWTVRTSGNGNGYYTLQNNVSGHYLDISGANAANGTNAQLWTKNGTAAQDFKFQKQADGSYAILTRVTSENSGLDVQGVSTNDNANVQQWSFGGGANQKWTLERQTGGVFGSNNTGAYAFEAPFTGMEWSLTTTAPNGYYTQWANMTGDLDGDGYITADEAKNIRGKSATMPDEVYGNTLSGQLDQDNLKLYYYFLPKTNLGGTSTKTGTITRAAESFYELAHNLKSINKATPVVGAYVDIGGFIGQTDGKGSYSIKTDLPSVGNVSTKISVDGSVAYYTVSKLQRHTPIVLPALSKFKAVSVSASYQKTSGAVADDLITVYNDMLTLSATVSSDSTLVPTKARFFIYDDQGNEKKEATGTGYTVEYTIGGNRLTTSLTFNPLSIIEQGDRVYVQFADQNGEWSNLIDLGYYFFARLNLAQFAFPLIGSASLENAITSDFVTDIIGNPLANITVGDLKGFEENSYSYTPMYINQEQAKEYTWLRTDYTFGWSKKFEGSKNFSNQKKKEEGDKEASESEKEEGAEKPSESEKEESTKEPSESEKEEGAEKPSESEKEEGDKEPSEQDKKEDNLKKDLAKVQNGEVDGKTPSSESKIVTKGKFKWSITPSVGFNLTLSSRKGNPNPYFEDLVFYVKVGFGVSASQTIQLPVGISIVVEGGVSGDMAGIYRMYVDYRDDYETEDAVEYTSEEFGVFKKFNNDVRREGYIFINPSVAIKLGVGYGIVFVQGKAQFDFDMDFQFTESSNNAYGDVTIDLGWAIQVAGFEVYAKELYKTTQEMFHTAGQNEHIELDYKSASTLALSSMEDYFKMDDELVLDQPVSREYLASRSEWQGDSGVLLSAIDASEGTVESILRNGTPNSPYTRMAALGDNALLMVFIDDDTTRTNVNKRALYYSIYDGAAWSEPVLVDDDGTADDYPALCDLGDGRILVAWSSVDQVLPDGATVEDALKAMNLKVAFFDKTTHEMGAPTQITYTTEEDYAADLMPGAAYDPSTQKLILYYTKTEYDDVSSLTTASSVNAYLFYDNMTGTWTTGEDYTEEERQNIVSSGKDFEQYKQNWYGQRFLDLRLNVASTAMPLVVDTASIGYNGLGLFAWTLDWDNDLETVNDRDVFVQIYNFAENTFSHIIRVTAESGAYTTPKFERSNNQTYLFYGVRVKQAVQDGEQTLDPSEGQYHGEIRYLNISDIIKNDKYTKKTDGDNAYYVLEYTRPAVNPDDLSESTDAFEQSKDLNIFQAKTVLITPDLAAISDNPMDYDVKVGGDGQIYLFWTEVEDEARQIVVSSFDGSDADISIEGSQTAPRFWSEPIVLTNAAGDEYYAGLGAAVLGDTLMVASAKGNYNDDSATAFALQQHTPFSKLVATDVRVDSEYPQPLSTAHLVATVKNEGLSTYQASSEQPITVTFTMNGQPVDTQQITAPIPGGTSVEVAGSAELPENITGLTFTAYVETDRVASVMLTPQSNVDVKNSQILYDSQNGYRAAYHAMVENTGNAALNDVRLTATVGDTKVGELTLASVEANTMQEVEMPLDIADLLYVIDDNGVGKAQVIIEVTAGGETITSDNGRAEKVFSKQAIDLLDQVTAITFANNGTYTIAPVPPVQSTEEVGQTKLTFHSTAIQPTISGVEQGALMVQWLESSDSNIAAINYDNEIVAGNQGVATLTGIVVPSEETIEFDENGNGTKIDWQTVIPSDKLRTVTATVKVWDGKSVLPGTGGSSSGSTPSYRVSFGSGIGFDTDIAPIAVNKDGTVSGLPTPTKQGYTFGGWYMDEALTKPFTADTKITANLTLYAKWEENTAIPGTQTPFKDVSENDWFFNAVKYVYENKLFSGVAQDTFAPNSALTRAMLVTVLYRAEGQPETAQSSGFVDVAQGSYYEKAVAWAKENGIVHGYNETEFAPDLNITREQIAAIMFRYAQVKGTAPQGEWAIELDYTDLGSIADWATEAVMFCKLKGIMQGDDNNTFKPRDNATRAQAAAILQRFLEDVKHTSAQTDAQN